MADSPDNVLIAILAAGASRRLGRPKQLVSFHGQPLLRRQCNTAIEAGVGPVGVILGCVSEEIRPVIADLAVQVRLNERWQEGLGRSIATAAGHASELGVSGLMLLHCDQYAITPADLRSLCRRWTDVGRDKAVRSRFDNSFGPPVLFPAHSFDALRELTGEEGARSVLAEFSPADRLDFDLPAAAVDLDTPAQLASISSS